MYLPPYQPPAASARMATEPRRTRRIMPRLLLAASLAATGAAVCDSAPLASGVVASGAGASTGFKWVCLAAAMVSRDMAGSGSAILEAVRKGLDRTVRSIHITEASRKSTMTEPFGQKIFCDAITG